MTTKIHILTDALGRPLRFLTAGQASDITTAPELLAGLRTTGVIAYAWSHKGLLAHINHLLVMALRA